MNSHTVAGDSKGFFFSPAHPHISTCVFLYILFVPNFFDVYSRTELYMTWQNDPLINTGHVSVLYVLMCRRESLLYVKFYEWLFFNLCI